MVSPFVTMIGVDRVAPESPDILTGLPRLTNSGAIAGDSKMKYIELTQGKRAIVDDEDFERINRWKWFANKMRDGTYYAGRTKIFADGSKLHLKMHRIIMNAPRSVQVDHRDHDTLDNRKLNMRLCTSAQNAANRRPGNNGSSKYKGVSWWKRGEKWQSYIKHNYKKRWLGYFVNEIDAARAYDVAAKRLFGEFAWLNTENFSEVKQNG